LPPYRQPKIGEPYTRNELLEYCALCDEQIGERVMTVDLDAESGFWWKKYGTLELQLNNIRHLKLHTGELMERLGARAGIEVDWVGEKSQAG